MSTRSQSFAALALATVGLACCSATAAASVTHTIQPGETLSGIASANGITTEALAAWNGLSSEYLAIAGGSITVPAPEEVGSTGVAGSTTSLATIAPAPWLAAIPSPWGDLYLDAGAANAWNAMREQALVEFGIDLHPAGPLSAYRTATEQGELYEEFLAGVGAPANPPGYSSHERGVSVDVATLEMRDVIDQIGWQYGWGKLEAPEEWWHVSWGG